LVGTESLKKELLDEGFDVVPVDYRGDDINYVLLGFDTELNYEKVRGACYYVSRGYSYIATNCDLKCPVLDNKFIPDCGAIAKMIELATNRMPQFLGKPERTMIDAVSSEWNVPIDKIACVGDRLYTDIAVGINAGATSICVLTGEATLDEIEASNQKPDYCFDSIKELYEALI
jgi:ribonucleotide monophosphatase NagD (HAD superfamily)